MLRLEALAQRAAHAVDPGKIDLDGLQYMRARRFRADHVLGRSLADPVEGHDCALGGRPRRCGRRRLNGRRAAGRLARGGGRCRCGRGRAAGTAG
jgi:hypothetical protein